MVSNIKGIPVVLIIQKEIGRDPFGKPITEDVEITVENVIVAPVTSEDAAVQLDLLGRKGIYMLGIPKGDTNTWENNEVRFFGRRWRVFGIPTQGMEHLMPLDWNKKVMVERYE